MTSLELQIYEESNRAEYLLKVLHGDRDGWPSVSALMKARTHAIAAMKHGSIQRQIVAQIKLRKALAMAEDFKRSGF